MIGSAVPIAERPDVSAAVGLPRSTRTLFVMDLPVAKLRRGPIRLIGISESGSAADLKLTPAAAATLGRFQ